jgi:hypothetical protein
MTEHKQHKISTLSFSYTLIRIVVTLVGNVSFHKLSRYTHYSNVSVLNKTATI